MASAGTHSATGDIVDDIVKAIKHYRFAIVGVVAAALAIGAAVVLLQPPVYEANASLFVRFGREYVYRPEVGQQTWSPYRGNELMNSELEILNSPMLKARLIDEMGAETLYPELDAAGEPSSKGQELYRAAKQWVKDALHTAFPQGGPGQAGAGAGAGADPAAVRRDAAIRRIEKDLSVKSPKESNVIYIAFRHQDPAMAERVIAGLIDAYLDQRLTIYREDRGNVLVEQAKRYEEALAAAQDELQTFKRTHGIADVRAQMDSHIRREGELTAAIQSIQLEVAVLRDRLTVLQRRGQTLTGGLGTLSMLDQAAVTRALEHQLNLMMREQEALATSGPKSPTVLMLRQTMDGVKTFLEQQRQIEIDRVNSEIALKATVLAGLEANMNATRQKIEQMTAYEGQLAALERKVEQHVHNYTTIRQKADEAGINRVLDQGRLMSVRPLQPPTARMQPVGLSAVARIGIGGALGLVFAVLLAVFLNRQAQRQRPMVLAPVVTDMLSRQAEDSYASAHPHRHRFQA